MSPNEAHQLGALARLHDLLTRSGVDYWVFGGWAVDLHAGRVTREHADPDLAIWHADGARIAALLAADGWSHPPERGEPGSTVYERGAVRLELASLERDDDGTIYTPAGDERGEWAPGAFGDDLAELAGVRARVIALEALRAEKSADRDDPSAAAKDHLDLTTLENLN